MGQGGVAHLDGNLSAAPIDTGYSWPGETVQASADGGKSWQTIFDGAGMQANGIWGIDLVEPGVGWAVGVTGLYRTENNGESWSSLREPSGQNLVAVDFSSRQLGWGLTTDGSLFVTDDGGDSWDSAPFESAATSICLTATRGYLVDQDGNVYTASPSGDDFSLALKTLGTSDAPVWSQVSCVSNQAWVSAQYTHVTSHDAKGSSYSLVGSSDDGSSWHVYRSDAFQDGSPPLCAVTALSSTTEGTPFMLGFPPEGWSLQVDSFASDSMQQLATIETLPRTLPNANDAHLYVLVQGAARVGQYGWLMLADNALGSTGEPVSQTVLLQTTDGGSSWAPLQ